MLVVLYTACLFITLTGSLGLLLMAVWPRVPDYRLKAHEALTPFVIVGFAWMAAAGPIIARRRGEYLEEMQDDRAEIGNP